MKNIKTQITFNSSGNCFVGTDESHFLYVKLFEVIQRRKPFIPRMDRRSAAWITRSSGLQITLKRSAL